MIIHHQRDVVLTSNRDLFFHQPTPPPHLVDFGVSSQERLSLTGRSRSLQTLG